MVSAMMRIHSYTVHSDIYVSGICKPEPLTELRTELFAGKGDRMYGEKGDITNEYKCS